MKKLFSWIFAKQKEVKPEIRVIVKPVGYKHIMVDERDRRFNELFARMRGQQ